MLSLLARFLLILSTIMVVGRVLRTLLAATLGRQPRQTSSRAAAAMVRDPVCGMYLDPSLALKSQSGRELVYFCSEECRKKYGR